MSLPQPSSQPSGEPSPQPFIPLESKDALGTGPANEMIARLAAALMQEQELEGYADAPVAKRRWPPLKTAVLLLVGCGLFWMLFFYTALAALF